jgi:hypothetical protein
MVKKKSILREKLFIKIYKVKYDAINELKTNYLKILNNLRIKRL